LIGVFCTALTLAFGPADAGVAFSEARALVEAATPRDAGTPGAARAAAHLAARARSLGASSVSTDVFTASVPGGTAVFRNVVAEIPGTGGTNAPWIVILSHYDTAPGIGPRFQGANDGASTSGLLLALARALVRSPVEPNIMLAWLDGEEKRVQYGPDDGLQGSKRLAGRLKSASRRVSAVICLDMLGDADLHIMMPGNVSPMLRKKVLAASRRAEVNVESFPYRVIDDHEPFLEAGFAAVDLIDFSFGPDNAWWHTENDRLERISASSLEAAGRLVVAIILD